MIRRLLGVCTAIAVACAGPLAAEAAATPVVQLDASGALTIDDRAAPTKNNLLVGKLSGAPSVVQVVDQDGADVIASDGCTQDTAYRVLCPIADLSSVTAFLAAGDDRMKIRIAFPATFYGGDGRDRLRGWSMNDVLDGGAGRDVLLGRGGDDLLLPGDGSAKDGGERADGGTGDDTVDLSDHVCAVTVTLDDQFNDGCAGENDNIQSNVEHVIGSAFDDSLSAGSGFAELVGGAGNDTLTAGLVAGGILRGGAGEDTLNALNGLVDTVDCGDDTDTWSADQGPDVFDVIDASCEV